MGFGVWMYSLHPEKKRIIIRTWTSERGNEDQESISLSYLTQYQLFSTL